MLRRNDVDPLLAGAIDPERIGLSGASAGGGTAVATAAGWPAKNVAPETRAKALLLYEPDPGSYDVGAAAAMTLPYLILHGDQFARSVPSYTVLLATTTAALPRIEVYNPHGVHRNIDSGLCRIIDDTREQALLADPTLPDPLTHQIAGNAAAEAAFNLWNIGAIMFPILGTGVGGGRNICNHVDVGSAVLPLDQDGDGVTDSPPFVPVDPPCVLVAPPAAEVVVPRLLHYSVAFWKTFLEGDHRYMPYLTPGYAKRNTGSIVTIWE
jgi:acetyl esterase/lipase